MEKIGKTLKDRLMPKKNGTDLNKIEAFLPSIQDLSPEALIQLAGFLKLLGGKAA